MYRLQSNYKIKISVMCFVLLGVLQQNISEISEGLEVSS